MKTQVNVEWAQSLLNTRKSGDESMAEKQRIDWVQNGKSFKRQLKFKLLPANSREQGIFGWVVGTHWSLGPNGDKRIICPETTHHLKDKGVKCPVCEAKRKLLAMGFKEEDLTVQGKYGPIPVFDPKLTSNVKVVVVGSDLKTDWDQQHVSVLQQNSDFLVRWLLEKQLKKDNPDFLAMNNCNCLEFTRSSDNGKWTREPSFTVFSQPDEVIEKIKEENEALYMPDVWKMPSDQEILEMHDIMEEMIKQYQASRDAMKSAVTEAVSSFENDSIPF